jgi:hypothetical protein
VLTVPALNPHQLNDATGRYINRILDLIEDTTTVPTRLDTPALQHALVRLAGFTHAILQQHTVPDGRFARCPTCRHAHTHRHTPCAVQPLAGLYLLEPLDVAWWQTLNNHGRNITLDEARTWRNDILY